MSKILTLHPQGKKGVNIDIQKYEIIKEFIIKNLEENGEMTYEKLNDLAIIELNGKFEGSISWYFVTVKLDLEARNIIERIPKT
ncbi:hypothetical protein EB169_05915, partial [archaeon]|nr:hypothetical protein [archaeon]